MSKKIQQLLQIAKDAYKQALEGGGITKKVNLNEYFILNAELQHRIRQIREANSQQIIFNIFIPEIIKSTLEKENYLISHTQALPIAVTKFNQELQAGRIDSLFRFVTSEYENTVGGNNGKSKNKSSSFVGSRRLERL